MIKKVLLIVIVAVALIIIALQVTFHEGNYYKKKISDARIVGIEIGAEVSATLSEDQVTALKNLLNNASWERIKNDVSTTHFIVFDHDFVIGILEASDKDLTIVIGRSKFLLTNVKLDIYSILTDKQNQ